MKILSWNVRRVNDREKRKVIKEFIKSQRAELACLQETKIHNFCVGVVRSFCSNRFSEWGVVDAVGATGRILLFWDQRDLELIEMVIEVFFVCCQLKNCEDGFQWTFLGV